MEMQHPTRDIIGSHGTELAGKKIVLCITGSVAAVRSVDIGRLLVRHGADVHVVMTESAMRLVGVDLLTWATGRAVVTELTGDIEHVALAGNVDDKADLVLVAPATANTIGKIACGIDDTTVTTVVTTAFGEGIPIVIVPAMHEPMYGHPIVRENIEKLETYGVKMILPKIEEGKAKIASPDTILARVVSLFGAGASLKGKKVLITAGRTVEYMDPVRVITNNSSGKMGMAIAASCRDAGADTNVIYGKGTAEPAGGVRIIRVESSDEMFDAVFEELGKNDYDIVFAAAAVNDWKPSAKAPKKVSTHTNKTLTIELEPTRKIIDRIKDDTPDVFLVAFRAQHGFTRDELIDDAKTRLAKARADLIATNDVSIAGAGFETDTNQMIFVDADGNTEDVPLAEKRVVADKLVESVVRHINKR